MGRFFSNIHIRKNDAFRMEELKKYFVEKMTVKGYRLESAEDSGECSVVIYAPADSEWVSVASDDFLFTTQESVRAATEPVSELFDTDVIAAECDDSDYLFLSLTNVSAGTDGWINIGRRYGLKNPRRTSIASWKRVVGDFGRFKKLMQQQYVFAEDAFYESAELLRMQCSQMSLETEHPEVPDGDQVEILTFYAPVSEKKLPKFEIPRFNLMPCRMGERDVVSVVNKGGKSRGIAVLFLGDYVENREITFEEVTIEYGNRSDRRVFPITLSLATLGDGKKAYYWEDKEFPIPPAVSEEIPLMKRLDLEFNREISIRFVPKGNERKALDITIVIAPLQNWSEGQTVWYVYRYSGSKKAYVEEHRGSLKSSGRFDPDEYEL